MKLEQTLNEASQALRLSLESHEIPPAPGEEPMTTSWNRSRVIGLAAAAALVVVALFLYTRDSPEIVIAGPPEIDLAVPLGDFSQWTYNVLDVTGGISLDPVTVQATDFQVDPSADPKLGLLFGTLEPWREPSSCTEIQSLLLPNAQKLRSPGSTAQEIRATCDGVEMVGAARVTWASSALVSVPAGEFEAVRIDVNITGFADPFPLTLSIFVDPTVGIVRHEAVGSSPGPTRHIRADLTDFEPSN